MAGFDNEVVYGSNVDFTGSATVSATVVTDGQLIIGSTATNVGGTHINVGVLTSPDSSITIGYSSPNITLTAASSITGSRTVTLPAGDYTVLTTDQFVGATSSAARAITLPASPTTNQWITIKDVTGSAGTNNITVSGNGHNIVGASSAATYVISQNGGSIDLQYSTSSTLWYVF